MKNFFSKVSVIFLSLFFASCAAENDQQAKIRIVDLQGKSHPVNTRVPEGNMAAISNQSRLFEEKNISGGEAKSAQNLAQNNQAQTAPDYGVVIQKTIQPSQERPLEKTSDDSIMAAGSAQNKEDTVEYDLSEEKTKTEKSHAGKSKKSAKPTSKKVIVSKTKQKGIFVQVGSFSSVGNAKQSLAEMQKFHKGRVETVEGEKTIYRVLLGPFPNKKKANALVKEIKDSGHEAILVRNK